LNGAGRDEAISKVKALALRVLADRLDNGEDIPELQAVFAIPKRVRRLSAGRHLASCESVDA